MKKTKLFICDKDNTLTESLSGSTFIESSTDQRLLPGVADRIAELIDMGATIVVASNQGGIAAGYKMPSELKEEMLFLKLLLPEISLILASPDYEGRTLYQYRFYSNSFEAQIENINDGCHIEAYFREDHDCYIPGSEGLYQSFRKPGGGMLQWAIQHFSDLETGFPDAVFVGDRPEDSEAAASAGIPFVDAEAWRSGSVKILPTGFIA
jgi:D-glycero-D-manno-heptose 1,7-bisphosphate phosphatase